MTDWTLVGGNPAPGDPDRLECRCGELDTTVEAIRNVDSELDRISRGTCDAGWQGKAADAMRSTLDKYRTDLTPIADSFDSVIRVLRAHATSLRDLQIRAKQAVKRAEAAQQAAERSEQQLATASAALSSQRQQLTASEGSEWSHYQTSLADVALNDPVLAASNATRAKELARRSASLRSHVGQLEHEARTHQNNLDRACGDLNTAKSDIRDLAEEWDEISKGAAKQVDAALDDSLRNRSNLEKLFDGVGNFFGELTSDIVDFMRNPSWETFRKALDRLGTILAVLAVVVAIIAVPFTGGTSLAVLAAIKAGLAIAALTVAALKLTSTIVLLSRGSSSVDGTDLVFDAIGVVLAGSAAKSGVAAFRSANFNRVAFNSASKASRDVFRGIVSRGAKGEAIKDIALGAAGYGADGPYRDAVKRYGVVRTVVIPALLTPIAPLAPLAPIVIPPTVRIPPFRFDLDVNVDVDVDIDLGIGIGAR